MKYEFLFRVPQFLVHQFHGSSELVSIGKQGLVCHPEYIARLLSHKVCKSAAKSYFYLFNLVEEELMEQREERLSLLRLSRVVTEEG